MNFFTNIQTSSLNYNDAYFLKLLPAPFFDSEFSSDKRIMIQKEVSEIFLFRHPSFLLLSQTFWNTSSSRGSIPSKRAWLNSVFFKKKKII